MASLAVDSQTCESVCERNPGGSCDCVCDVPCAFNADGKVVEWTCVCKNQDSAQACRCKFQIRCNREGGCQGDCVKETFTSACQCGKKECSIQIRKCPGCEVIRVDCECPEGGSCSGKAAAAKSCEGCACSGGKC